MSIENTAGGGSAPRAPTATETLKAESKPGEGSPPTAPEVAASPAVLKTVFNKQPRDFDMSKPEDVAALKNYAERGMFGEHTAAEVKRLKTELASQSRDAEVGREMKDWMANDPLGASALQETYRALRERGVDPAVIRSAVSAQQQGDGQALEAQARATQDPQASALLNGLATELKGVKSELVGIREANAQREATTAISGALAGETYLDGRAAAQGYAHRRTRELYDSGMPVDLAASQAVQEAKELATESATQERDRLRGQQELRTTSPNDGIPPLSKLASDARASVDKSAPAAVQKEQKRESMRGFLDNLGQRMRGSP